jgi:hypothetical protein
LKRKATALFFLASGGVVSAACSLGLNKGLIGESTDAATPRDSSTHTEGSTGGDAADSGSSEASTDGSGGGDTSMPSEGGPGPEGGADSGVPESSTQGCTQASECTSPNGCLTGRCVMPEGKCVFDLCPASMCNGYQCDTSTNSCGPATPYAYQAAAVPVGAGISCALASACVGASFPFVYVGTTEGVYAVNASDPALTTAPVTAVGGIPFFPTQVVESGTRVYFVGALQTSGTNYMVPVAWIDPPADPTAPLEAQSSFVVYPAQTLSAAYPGGTLGLFLESDLTSGPYNALLTAPLPNPSTVTLSATPLAQGAPGEDIVGASLGNLVLFRVLQNAARFALVTGAGTPGAAAGLEQDISDGPGGFGQVSTGGAFAGGPDGSFLFSAAAYNVSSNYFTDVRFAWVLGAGGGADGGTAPFASTYTIVEPYSPPAGQSALDQTIVSPLAGPIGWLDAQRAMVLAAATTMTPAIGLPLSGTSVQVVTEESAPPALAQDSTGTTLRAVLATSTNQAGLATAQSPSTAASFGYVLTADSATTSTVHIFAPDCLEQ